MRTWLVLSLLAVLSQWGCRKTQEQCQALLDCEACLAADCKWNSQRPRGRHCFDECLMDGSCFRRGNGATCPTDASWAAVSSEQATYRVRNLFAEDVILNGTSPSNEKVTFLVDRVPAGSTVPVLRPPGGLDEYQAPSELFRTLEARTLSGRLVYSGVNEGDWNGSIDGKSMTLTLSPTDAGMPAGSATP